MLRIGPSILKWIACLCFLGAFSAGAEAGKLSNTAHATATAPGGAAVASPTDFVELDVVPANPVLTAGKSGTWSDTDAKPGFSAGDSISWAVVVNNTGNVTIESITVADAAVSLVCAPQTDNTIPTLAPGGSITCTGTSTVLQADIDANGGGDGDIDNVANVSGATLPGAPVSVSASANVPVVLLPSMSVVKTAYLGGLPLSLGGAGTTPVPANQVPGTVITYVYVVTNTGNSTITNVTMSDAHDGLGAAVVPGSEAGITTTAGSTDAAVNGSWDALRPGDVIAFSANYTLTQDDVDQRQ